MTWSNKILTALFLGAMLFVIMQPLDSWAQVEKHHDIQERSAKPSDEEELPEEAHIRSFPVWGPAPNHSPSRVVQAFPQDGAIFPQGSAVTLGWWGIHPDFFPLDHYEMLIIGDTGYYERKNLGPYELDKPTFLHFTPPAPGKYFWQVWAHMTDGTTSSSLGRVFTVGSQVSPR